MKGVRDEGSEGGYGGWEGRREERIRKRGSQGEGEEMRRLGKK